MKTSYNFNFTYHTMMKKIPQSRLWMIHRFVLLWTLYPIILPCHFHRIELDLQLCLQLQHVVKNVQII